MELFIIFGLIGLPLCWFVTMMEDDVKYMDKVFIALFASVLLIWFIWIQTTEVTYESMEIKETADFIYYIDHNNNITSLPSNTVDVIKIIPRKGSVEEYKYRIKLE